MPFQENIIQKSINRLEKDKKLLFIGLELSNLASPPTSLKDKNYTENDFFKDLNIYMPKKFPGFPTKKIEPLWKRFKKIFKKIELFKNLKEFQELDYKIYTIHFNLLKEEIFSQLYNLSNIDKLIVYVFIRNKDQNELMYNINDEHLYSYLKEIAEKKYKQKIPFNAGDILIRMGLLFLSSYIDTQKRPQGLYYEKPAYLKEFGPLVISSLLKDKSFLMLLEKLGDFKLCSYCNEKFPVEFGECPLCGHKG